MVLDTGGVMNSDVETCLANLLERNEERYKEFYKHCHKKSFSIVPWYWFIIGITYSKISNFYPHRQIKPKTIHVKVPS